MNLRRWAIGLFGFWAGGACMLHAAPKTDPFSLSWTLDIEFFDPQRITVNGTTYWYVLYQVTNRTGQDVQFFPSSRLVTDTLEVVEGGANVNPLVYDFIAARHKQQYPFFAPPTKITGPLLQGVDNARASAMVFRTFDASASGFTIFVSGLSGEKERLRNPAFDASQPESDSNPRAFLLQRTLSITYSLPGDPTTRGQATPIRKNREWVMR